jgi:hypothetical protein
MGLRIMNYRANTIGATFDIKPNHKNGTIVTCALPVKNGARILRDDESAPAPVSSGGGRCRAEMVEVPVT